MHINVNAYMQHYEKNGGDKVEIIYEQGPGKSLPCKPPTG